MKLKKASVNSNNLSHTNIEWVKNLDGSKGYVFNPVWGCLNSCPYCYARKMAKRFAFKIANKEIRYRMQIIELPKEGNELLLIRNRLYQDLIFFLPTWIESNFNKSFPKKPSRIFVNSMSDIEYWKPEWMNRMLDKIKEYPQHRFLFLTKEINVYDDYKFSQNCWLGITITNQIKMNFFADRLFETTFDEKNKIFISIEPILEEIKLYIKPDWLIIGAETGNRKNKIIPKKEWIVNLLLAADKDNIPVFMKDNLKSVWGEDLIQEFPG